MTRNRDEEVEARAVDLAEADRPEWVKRPRREGQPNTPAAATNVERDVYRQQARDKMDGGNPKGDPTP